MYEPGTRDCWHLYRSFGVNIMLNCEACWEIEEVALQLVSAHDVRNSRLFELHGLVAVMLARQADCLELAQPSRWLDIAYHAGRRGGLRFCSGAHGDNGEKSHQSLKDLHRVASRSSDSRVEVRC